jgi:hypothetical protein
MIFMRVDFARAVETYDAYLGAIKKKLRYIFEYLSGGRYGLFTSTMENMILLEIGSAI